MAKDLWAEAEDDDISGEYIHENNDFPVIPHETRVKVIIDKAAWENKKNYKNNEKEENCISLRFDIEDGEFKGQKLFKKCFIESDNEDQQMKDWRLFSAVDINAGGKCKSLKRKPTDEELSRYLINKSMVIVVGMMAGKNGQKDANYVMGVSAGKSDNTATKTPQKASAPSKPKVDYGSDDDSDIPF